MYISLNDIDKTMLERISDKLSIRIETKNDELETLISAEVLLDLISEMEDKYDELYEIHQDFEREVQENYVKQMGGYEYGE